MRHVIIRKMGKRPVCHMGREQTLSLRYDVAYYFGHTLSGYDFEIVRRFVSWNGMVREIQIQIALREDEESNQSASLCVKMDGAEWTSFDSMGADSWEWGIKMLGFPNLRKALDAGRRNEQRNAEALVRFLQRDAFQLANETMLRRM